jgi:hypothetical protein
MDGTGENHLKFVKFRKPKATNFLIYIKYRPGTNTSNIMKKRSH